MNVRLVAKNVSAFLMILSLPILMGFSKTPIVDLVPEGDEVPMGDCKNHNPLKNPHFGDLHVHTEYSFDAVTFGTRNDPSDAYKFAKGEPLTLPFTEEYGEAQQVIQLDRPLDFTAVTDHAEGLAPANICYNLDSLWYFAPYCFVIRGSGKGNQPIDTLSFLAGGYPMFLPGGVLESTLCEFNPGLCKDRKINVWNRIQNIAEEHYDRTTDCNFTTFVAYEYTGVPLLNNQHRNVIFKNGDVPETPIDYLRADKDYELWNLLDQECTDAEGECEVLAIPHNQNVSGGTMFVPSVKSEPYTEEIALQRQRLEPLVEIYQHKGDSECTNSKAHPLGSQDELCEFDKLVRNACEGDEEEGETCTPLCSDLKIPVGGFVGLCVDPGDFVRGTLKKGLLEKDRIGVDPFKTGFIGSTDTHNATPGAVAENEFYGNAGFNDDLLEDRLGNIGLVSTIDELLGGALDSVIDISDAGSFTLNFSPGGLAVVWAEQNTRTALFESMQNKETYATSGTRIITRFFGGWDYSEQLCDSVDFVEQGYAQGVPMGGDLSQRPASAEAPVFAVSAQMDLGSDKTPGTPLQRIQIIKGWEENGEAFERVFDIAGDPDNGASVNTETCERQGTGFEQLCSVWQDPDFDANQNAFYYAKVVENPTCRWHRMQCNEKFARENLSCEDLDPNSPLYKCCETDVPDTVQETAWTSPIWFSAED